MNRSGLADIRIARYRAGAREPCDDRVAVEEPLEIRIAGETFAVTMRTPGHDEELVLGLLLAEGIVRSVDDVGGIAHCGKPGELGNVIDVSAAPGAVIEWDPEGAVRRATLTTSACGVCGRRSVEDLLARVRPLDDGSRFSVQWVEHLTRQLGPRQANFAASGGVHAAALFKGEGLRGEGFSAEGRSAAADAAIVREDVGRHNAVDKVVGRCALDRGLPANGRALVVSGRASFELVQKAVVAQIPLLVSVSAPSSLAVSAAQAARLTLVGFARGERFNVYAGEERLRA
jgi:FdhD protein